MFWVKMIFWIVLFGILDRTVGIPNNFYGLMGMVFLARVAYRTMHPTKTSDSAVVVPAPDPQSDTIVKPC